MGLLDAFKSEPKKLTPKLFLAAGMLYMISSDDEISPLLIILFTRNILCVVR